MMEAWTGNPQPKPKPDRTEPTAARYQIAAQRARADPATHHEREMARLWVDIGGSD